MPTIPAEPHASEVPSLRAPVESPRADLRAFVTAVAALIALSVVAVGLEYVALADVAMLSLVAIMLAALVGRGLALVAVSLAVLTLNYFMPPRFALAIEDRHQLATIAIQIGAGLAISTLIIRLRLKERDARDRERRTAALLAFTRDVAAAADVPAIAGVTLAHVEDILGGVAVVLIPDDDRLKPTAGLLQLAAPELAVARWSFEHGLPAGRTTGVMAQTEATAIPLRTADEIHGVLVFGRSRRARNVDVEQRDMIEALGRQAGFAIGRLHLAAEAHEASLRARAEELRSSLLSAVSHDLRTPLGVITGAATSLRDDADRFSPQARAQLVDTIVHEAQRLERVLQNLLAITRVETGLRPAREWVPVEELCGTALGRLADRLGDREITVEVPRDLSVSVDPVLFEHVLINLIENAIKHGAPPLRIAARRLEDGVELTVSDCGPGLPRDCELRIFDKFFRVPGSRVPGVGLGLAVCRGIVVAHGGTITATNGPAGGACFRVVLPGAPPAMEATG